VSTKFFGQFLLERGAITGPQLVAAVAIQEKTNVLLGTRAIDAGYMTVAQVDEINLLQRSVDRRFGELAVEKQYLTEDQLKNLLGRQKEQRLMLGEALIKLGALDNARLAAELAAFKKEAGGVPGTIAEVYDGLRGAAILEVIADVACKMFLRIVHQQVRLGNRRDGAGKIAPADYTIHQRIKGDVNAAVCLNLSAALMKTIGGTMLGVDDAEFDADTLDGGAEFVNVVCGIVCARLSGAGRRVDLDPPRVHAWREGAFDFAAVGRGAQVVGTPLLHPDENIELVVIL
jgi:CheY-specific phosphatase CheX